MSVVSRSFGYLVGLIFLFAVGLQIKGFVPSSILPDKEAPETVVVVTAPVVKPLEFPEYYKIEGFNPGQLRTIKNSTEADIKNVLSRGDVVLGLVDARILNNPFLDQTDFVYVTLVGYTKTHFISDSKFTYLITDFMRALSATGGDIIAVHLESLDDKNPTL